MERLISDCCKMEQKHLTILHQHWSKIRDYLEPNNILSKLDTVLLEIDEVEIKGQSTSRERCDKLLAILPRKGPTAFKLFLEALKEEDPDLADVLIEAGNKEDPNQSSALRDRSIN